MEEMMSLWRFTWLELEDGTCAPRELVLTARKACSHLQRWLLARAARWAAAEARGAPGKYRSGTSGDALTNAVEHG